MGSSSGQVTGYKYHTNLILFIGNAIEKVLGINFDNRGWLNPLVDENSAALLVGTVNSPDIYGENEGGVSGKIHARYGTDTQQPVQFYSKYLAENDIPPLAYQLQSYLAFEDFYVGNSGYMKEMLLWPKRTRKKNDGTEQWYQLRSNGAVVCEIDSYVYIKDTDQVKVEVGQGFDVVTEVKTEGFINRNVIYHKYKGGGDVFSAAILKSGLVSQGDIGLLDREVSIALSVNQKFSGVATVLIYSELIGEEMTFTVLPDDGLVSVNLSSEIVDSYGVKHQVWEATYRLSKTNRIAAIARSKGRGQWGDHGTGTTAGIGMSFPYPIVEQSLSDHKGLDLNPIHKIREILTDRTAMNKPESEINEENFIKAANRIWDDGLGISWAIQEKSCIEAINELCFHIEAGIRINRQTGLYEMILFRDDWFAESEIHFLAGNKIKSIELEVQNGYEVVNQLNVNFYDRENIKNSSFCVAENASIKNLNGKVNAETVDFPYFMNQRNAEIVAKWKLRQFTSSGWKGSFTTSEKQARKWNRYDIVKINWSRKGIANLPVRILSLKFGGHTSSSVTIEFEEVAKSLGNLDTTIIIDDGIDNTVQAPKPCNAKVFELPFFEAVQAKGERETNAELAANPEAGFICAIAKKPQNNSLNAALHVNNGNGFEKAATINYCETAYLEDSINKIASSFVVKNVGDLASVRVGSQIFINDEIMVYQSLNAQSKVLTVKRGALDTVPQDHDADRILYFADDFVAIDQTLYVDGEQIQAKVLTTTPSGVLSLNDAETHIAELNSRAIRPYPPANVKINGEFWPETNMATNDIVITWVHRNRTQQTGGEIVGWFDGGVTIEEGVTYSLELSTANDGVIHAASGISAAIYTIDAEILKPDRAHKLRIWALRNNFDSYYGFEHNFFVEAVSLILTASVTNSGVSGNTLHEANINVNVDTSLKANMQFDGSGIVCKTLPNSTITIEIEG